MSRRGAHTLPAPLVGARVSGRALVKPPAGAATARRSKPAGLLTAYRLPVFVSRPPFSPVRA